MSFYFDFNKFRLMQTGRCASAIIECKCNHCSSLITQIQFIVSSNKSFKTEKKHVVVVVVIFIPGSTKNKLSRTK